MLLTQLRQCGQKPLIIRPLASMIICKVCLAKAKQFGCFTELHNAVMQSMYRIHDRVQFVAYLRDPVLKMHTKMHHTIRMCTVDVRFQRKSGRQNQCALTG